MVVKRRRFKQTDTLEQRLAAAAKRLREQAKVMSPGIARDKLIRRARQVEAASQMSQWLRS
ncbi:MAG: hypothetical protein KGK01_01995 [Bradyrhizobium sp.]|uniref:hypothetical protein n=1 Tax=Bradyrhizobium sp. TaxID=376 RepID=UPI001C2A081A|nr:hypothetical protein [Bradyrhizobium sp.]MBU6463580.1 hypothetical protein [Pseudomonadota bacterium]MDE2067034.1 hypothetical protein [Bradyrhizobium sp.]MDE2241236.1 hypothetical protein [Bradyrhizobium sp.]